MLINPYIFAVAGGGGDPIAFREVSDMETMPSFGGTVTIDKPVGTLEDDVMFAWFGMESVNGTGSPDITCAGWTEIAEVPAAIGSGDYYQLRIYMKVAGASEPSTYDFVVDIAPPLYSGSDCGIISFSGADPADPIDDLQLAENSPSNDVTCASVTATVTDTLLVCFYGGTNGSSATTPISCAVSMTVHEATTGSDYSHVTIASEAISATGATGTRVGDYQGVGNFYSRCVSILLKKP